MSEEKKSPIVSTAVSMNAGREKKESPEQEKAYKKVSLPWHILICSDLGYVSEAPGQIRAASLNEFLDSQEVVLQGTIESSLAGKPVFVEYPVRDFKDFSSPQVSKNLPITADLRQLSSLLEDILAGTISREQGIEAVYALKNESPLITEALRLLRVAPSPGSAPQASHTKQESREKTSALDSILDSVVVEPAAEEKKEEPVSAVDKLSDALVGDTQPSLPKEQVLALIEKIETALGKDMTALLSQQFFHDRRASWGGCRHCAKIIGRNNEVSLSVFSAPFSEIDEKLPGVVNTLAQQGRRPDIILFDYPLQITNAHTDILARIGEQAELNHVMVLSHFSQEEPFISKIADADTLKPIFEEPTFIPYQRLRKNSFARTLCLAAPHGVIDSSDITPVSAGGGWLVLFTFVQRICDGRSPFDGGVTLADTGITAEHPLRHAKGMNRDHTIESLEMGITLLSDIVATQAGVPAVSIIDSESIASQYTSFAYNLLTNRLLKITESVISEGGANSQEIAERLRRGLLEFLDGYRLLHSENEVTVTPDDNGEIAIAVESEKTVDEYPIQIQYSVNT